MNSNTNFWISLIFQDPKVKLIGNTPGDKVLKLGDPQQRGYFGPNIITTGVVNLYEGITVSKV